MSNITIDRAVKRAYFSGLSGENILEFQFSPAELNFVEGGRYVDRIPTGSYFNQPAWVSGKASDFSLRMFIDRTQESYTAENYNEDPFQGVTRFPSRIPLVNSLDIAQLIRGIVTGNTSSGFQSSFKKKHEGKHNEVAPSNYSASPHYRQSAFNEGAGVISDLESLLYFVRPKGLRLSELTIEEDGKINIEDFDVARFTPPPKVRFYQGSIWREGYMVEVAYNLSVMNKQLVPMRMDARIKIACTNWGYLNELSSSSVDSAIDVTPQSPNFA